LRSLTSFPSMRMLVSTLILAVGRMSSVIILLLGVLSVFSMLAVQSWGWNGNLHGRCRLVDTPMKLPINFTFPGDSLSLSSDYNADPVAWACLPGVPNNNPSWTSESSPWATPQPCIWPIDHTNPRLW
jgi:hypothetical protein